ncbi:hypothetical protein LJY25_11520 [Hymenobacter sp. BT175]|uniref:hypothetical protein n=1 Tax=Hymenobacter translucens TaxID=2886507 RepID=UPI001D0E7B9A|nr:hypothetical protein [Hymenobacter translucens]MCC2547078.1 hypothetical protein [Hymenobacter translucens]
MGATKVAEQEVTYYGEQPKRNFVFELTKSAWAARTTKAGAPAASSWLVVL